MGNETALEKLERLMTTDIPVEVQNDVNSRVKDWLVSGGDANDPYIDQQIRFVENYKKYGKRK